MFIVNKLDLFQAQPEADQLPPSEPEGVSSSQPQPVATNTSGMQEVMKMSVEDAKSSLVTSNLVSWPASLYFFILCFQYLKLCIILSTHFPIVVSMLCGRHCINVPSLFLIQTVNKPRILKQSNILFFLQPKSETTSEKRGVGVKKAVKSAIDKSMVPKLNTFKNFLSSKLKKGEKEKQNVKDAENLFHGFSDDEIRSASLNDSSSERSSIISSISKEDRDEKKKRKSEMRAARAAEEVVVRGAAGEVGESSSLPLLHQPLLVEGKRQKKPSSKLQDMVATPQVNIWY